MIGCEILSADPSGILRMLLNNGIVLQDMEFADALTIRFYVPWRQYKLLCRLAESRGGKVRVLVRRGIIWQLLQISRRPVLLVGILIMLALSLWVPTRVFFVQVEGNESVHTNQILEQAARCGIGFGASRRQVRSEKMKNALLSQIPQLQWAGVNTYGCVAVISVKERTVQQTTLDSAVVSSIVSSREGVIRTLTVTKGIAQCQVGQTVKAGEVLISGVSAVGDIQRAGVAEGEIFAETLRDLVAYAPTQYALRTENTQTSKKYGLIIGKKRINFWNNSGISHSSCVRIYLEHYVTLPGGFRLPIGYYVDEHTCCRIVSCEGREAGDDLQKFMRDYLRSIMIGGQILSETYLQTEAGGFARLDGRFQCLEMIGITRIEESVLDYEDH